MIWNEVPCFCPGKTVFWDDEVTSRRTGGEKYLGNAKKYLTNHTGMCKFFCARID